MSDRAKAILGFGFAAGVLILLAEVAPRLAVGTAALIGLGVVLKRPNEISNIVDQWTAAVSKTK